MCLRFFNLLAVAVSSSVKGEMEQATISARSSLLFTRTAKRNDCSSGIDLGFIILPKDTSTQLQQGQKQSTHSPVTGFGKRFMRNEL